MSAIMKELQSTKSLAVVVINRVFSIYFSNDLFRLASLLKKVKEKNRTFVWNSVKLCIWVRSSNNIECYTTISAAAVAAAVAIAAIATTANSQPTDHIKCETF